MQTINFQQLNQCFYCQSEYLCSSYSEKEYLLACPNREEHSHHFDLWFYRNKNNQENTSAHILIDNSCQINVWITHRPLLKPHQELYLYKGSKTIPLLDGLLINLPTDYIGIKRFIETIINFS